MNKMIEGNFSDRTEEDDEFHYQIVGLILMDG